MQGLNLIDLEDLLEDIKVYCEIEQDSNTDYWIVRSYILSTQFKGRGLVQREGSCVYGLINVLCTCGEGERGSESDGERERERKMEKRDKLLCVYHLIPRLP